MGNEAGVDPSLAGTTDATTDGKPSANATGGTDEEGAGQETGHVYETRRESRGPEVRRSSHCPLAGATGATCAKAPGGREHFRGTDKRPL